MGTIKREPAIRAFSLMMVLTMLISIQVTVNLRVVQAQQMILVVGVAVGIAVLVHGNQLPLDQNLDGFLERRLFDAGIRRSSRSYFEHTDRCQCLQKNFQSVILVGWYTLLRMQNTFLQSRKKHESQSMRENSSNNMIIVFPHLQE